MVAGECRARRAAIAFEPVPSYRPSPIPDVRLLNARVIQDYTSVKHVQNRHLTRIAELEARVARLELNSPEPVAGRTRAGKQPRR